MPSKFYCKHTLIARVCYGMLANVFYLQSDFNELLKSDTPSTTFECVFSIFFLWKLLHVLSSLLCFKIRLHMGLL